MSGDVDISDLAWDRRLRCRALRPDEESGSDAGSELRGGRMRERRAWRMVVAALTVAVFLVTAAVVQANVALNKVSADPYANASSQHATEEEPDTFADHGTVVAAFQVGRFFNGGASDIGVARSGDGGSTWGPPGFLHDTFNAGDSGSPYERVSDASVAYDRMHGVWLISSIPLL